MFKKFLPLATFIIGYFLGASTPNWEYLQCPTSSTYDENTVGRNDKNKSKSLTITHTPRVLNNTPQVLKLGKRCCISAYPYLSMDIWYEIVDNNTNFFLRPQNMVDDMATEEYWLKWLDSLPWPVELLMNNNLDKPFPDESIPIKTSTLAHKNIKKLFVMNPDILHPKVFPLPIGPKWQWMSSDLYGEPREWYFPNFHNASKSPQETKILFESPSRNEKVWIRPTANVRNGLYNKSSKALMIPRSEMCRVVQNAAPNLSVCAGNKVDGPTYWDELKRYRFMVSSAGRGLDVHATYEAIMAGCIPIVPKSPMSPLYDRLPVWVVDAWEEVTDAAIEAKSKEFKKLNAENKLRWDLVFADNWAKEFLSGRNKEFPIAKNIYPPNLDKTAV